MNTQLKQVDTFKNKVKAVRELQQQAKDTVNPFAAVKHATDASDLGIEIIDGVLDLLKDLLLEKIKDHI